MWNFIFIREKALDCTYIAEHSI